MIPRPPAVSLAAPLLAALLAAPPAFAADEITVYRCRDGSGHVALQDEPCAAGDEQSTVRMARPQDPPTRPRPAPPPTPPADPGMPPPERAWAMPPPPMFACTDYDGEVRFSEDYAPTTRCVPLAVLGYDVTPRSSSAATCRWVQESCLRLDDAEACERFREKLRQARSDALHAFSDTAAFRKSEAERLGRIVDESCR